MSQPTHAVRTAAIVSAFCECLLLLDETNARAQEPSAESPTRFQVGIGFLGAGGIGDFGARTDGAAGLLHGLSGMASLLQATELARLTATTEGALRDGSTDALPLLFDELQAAMHTVEASVDRLEARWISA